MRLMIARSAPACSTTEAAVAGSTISADDTPATSVVIIVERPMSALNGSTWTMPATLTPRPSRRWCSSASVSRFSPASSAMRR
jgi:hypothetical protein